MGNLTDTETLLCGLVAGVCLGAIVMWLCVRTIRRNEAGLLQSYVGETTRLRDEVVGLRIQNGSLKQRWEESQHSLELAENDIDNCTERISKAAHVLSNSLEYAVRGRVHTGSVLSALHFLKDSLPVTPEEKIQERSEDATRGLDPEARHR